MLVLTAATPADSGNYTCTATNTRGSWSESTEIKIELSSGTVLLPELIDMIGLWAGGLLPADTSITLSD